MKTTVNFSQTDYMKIAAFVADNAPDDASNYEVEYKANGYTLYLDMEHEISYNVDKWRRKNRVE